MLDMYIFKNEVHVTFFSHCQSYSFSFFLFIVARILILLWKVSMHFWFTLDRITLLSLSTVTLPNFCSTHFEQ